MSIILITILAVSTNPSDPTPDNAAPVVQSAAPAAMRSGRELSEAAHAAMRRWAKVADPEAEAAARDLLNIYREIQQDTRMARSQRETLRVTVRARLDQLCTQITRRIAKDKPAAKAGSGVKSVAANKNSAGGVALAQIGLPPGAAGGQNANANTNADYGQQLVDLIQNTISPKSWDVNGGSATIYYWQQQHAIVVRATDDVHGEISDTLEQLNRASH
jgi:hypothetical protein